MKPSVSCSLNKRPSDSDSNNNDDNNSNSAGVAVTLEGRSDSSGFISVNGTLKRMRNKIKNEGVKDVEGRGLRSEQSPRINRCSRVKTKLQGISKNPFADAENLGDFQCSALCVSNKNFLFTLLPRRFL